ncbi:hypothetical protein EON65_46055 [archaeon]|nr:MAG: hypothetical protein EON65_46055 [archaeon]
MPSVIRRVIERVDVSLFGALGRSKPDSSSQQNRTMDRLVHTIGLEQANFIDFFTTLETGHV